jgi:hypothetical protein
MQMFFWNRGPQIHPLIVNSPSNYGRNYVTTQNYFEWSHRFACCPTILQSDLVVLYLDSSAGTSQACVYLQVMHRPCEWKNSSS